MSSSCLRIYICVCAWVCCYWTLRSPQLKFCRRQLHKQTPTQMFAVSVYLTHAIVLNQYKIYCKDLKVEQNSELERWSHTCDTPPYSKILIIYFCVCNFSNQIHFIHRDVAAHHHLSTSTRSQPRRCIYLAFQQSLSRLASHAITSGDDGTERVGIFVCSSLMPCIQNDTINNAFARTRCVACVCWLDVCVCVLVLVSEEKTFTNLGLGNNQNQKNA